MTEAEFLALPMEQRRSIPIDELLDVVFRTLDDMHETLAIEGFEFVGYDESEAGTVAGVDRPEVWKREINGQVEWYEVWEYLPNSNPISSRTWLRNRSPCDPRTISD
ncbi:MAG TPA: hypothetical protein VG122_12760 [Gemmata sp.]|jgi:hypothetical protein|nr:hypothetical protein [Gemmata sp.]